MMHQQEQILCGLRDPEIVATQRHRGGKHHVWQPLQQAAVRPEVLPEPPADNLASSGFTHFPERQV